MGKLDKIMKKIMKVLKEEDGKVHHISWTKNCFILIIDDGKKLKYENKMKNKWF